MKVTRFEVEVIGTSVIAVAEVSAVAVGGAYRMRVAEGSAVTKGTNDAKVTVIALSQEKCVS